METIGKSYIDAHYLLLFSLGVVELFVKASENWTKMRKSLLFLTGALYCQCFMLRWHHQRFLSENTM